MSTTTSRHGKISKPGSTGEVPQAQLAEGAQPRAKSAGGRSEKGKSESGEKRMQMASSIAGDLGAPKGQSATGDSQPSNRKRGGEPDAKELEAAKKRSADGEREKLLIEKKQQEKAAIAAKKAQLAEEDKAKRLESHKQKREADLAAKNARELEKVAARNSGKAPKDGVIASGLGRLNDGNLLSVPYPVFLSQTIRTNVCDCKVYPGGDTRPTTGGWTRWSPQHSPTSTKFGLPNIPSPIFVREHYHRLLHARWRPGPHVLSRWSVTCAQTNGNPGMDHPVADLSGARPVFTVTPGSLRSVRARTSPCKTRLFGLPRTCP